MHARAVPLLVALSACTTESEPRVVDATFEGMFLHAIMLLGGTVGLVNLDVRYDNGKDEEVVALALGGHVGLLADVSFGFADTTFAALPASGRLSDLFQTYHGDHWSVVLGMGARSHDLRNPAGAWLSFYEVGFVFGLQTGKESLYLFPLYRHEVEAPGFLPMD